MHAQRELRGGSRLNRLDPGGSDGLLQKNGSAGTREWEP